MRYIALACDYDGTIAHDGIVAPEIVASLRRLRESGRKLIMVTGRELEDLKTVFPEYELFDRLVCENGGLIYDPASKQEKALGEPPSQEFVVELRHRGVKHISVGRTVIGTWHPHEMTVFQTIRDMGLELQVIFNKGAVMILPPGVNKGSGLLAALDELGLSAHNTVAAGDAENDHALLNVAEFGVATANALPALKDRADYVSINHHGYGVMEVIELMLENDLSDFSVERHKLLMGTTGEDVELLFSPYGESLLIAGQSSGGKTTITFGLIEQLARAEYQFCLVDPEGDYEVFPYAVKLGDANRAPGAEEIAIDIQRPSQNVIANLLGARLEDRPAFLSSLLPRIQQLRMQTGRPHWLVIDEAHHMMGGKFIDQVKVLPDSEFILITVHPEKLPDEIFERLTGLIAVGDNVEKTVSMYCKKSGVPMPDIKIPQLKEGQALVWLRKSGKLPMVVNMVQADIDRKRHRRKYAQGQLPPHRSFYFTGPNGKLNLRVQNLELFNQIAEGVDDETWLHHLRNHDYSRWFREMIKDDGLSQDARRIEDDHGMSARESRKQIRQVIEQRYTASA